MKFGMRKPSIKKSIAARTTGRVKRNVKREMQNEILRLQEENIKLKQKEDVSTKIERHKDAYITLKDDKEKIIYCANCWDSRGVLVQGQSYNDGTYYCSTCKEKKYYDMDLYDKTYPDYDYDDSNII